VVSYKLGEFLLGNQPQPFSVRDLSWAALKPYAKAILLGSSVIGLITAIAAYFACYWLVVRFRRKDAGLAELTNESVLTGEDLEQALEHKEQGPT